MSLFNTHLINHQHPLVLLQNIIKLKLWNIQKQAGGLLNRNNSVYNCCYRGCSHFKSHPPAHLALQRGCVLTKASKSQSLGINNLMAQRLAQFVCTLGTKIHLDWYNGWYILIDTFYNGGVRNSIPVNAKHALRVHTPLYNLSQKFTVEH